MLTYYIIYGLLFISTIFELSDCRTKKVVLILWGVFFTMFAGLRWQTGTDWDSYLQIYNDVDFTNIFTYDRYGNGRDILEPGYAFLNASVKAIFEKYHFFNLIECVIIQGSFYKACKYFTPRTPIITYIFLIVFGGIFPIRSTLGLAVAFWAYKYIKEQNLLKFLLVMLLTCSIHMKYIIFLPCFWLGKLKLKWYWFFIIYLSIVGLYVVFQQQIALLATLLDASSGVGNKLLVYTESETEGFSGLSYIGVALNVFLMSIYLYMRKIKVVKDERWMNAILNMYLASCCIYALFSDGMGDLARLATLFILPQTLLLVTAINYYKHSKNPLLVIGANLFFVLYFAYRAFQTTHAYFFEDACVPYKSIFDYNISLF